MARINPQELELEVPPHMERVDPWEARRAPRQASPDARIARAQAKRGEALRGEPLRGDDLRNHDERPVEPERRRRRSVIVVRAAAVSTTTGPALQG